MRATAAGAGLGLMLAGTGFVLPDSGVGLLVLGIVMLVGFGGASIFARSRAALIEPELAQLRRGEAVAQWDMTADQWAGFSRSRRARSRAWVLGGAAGLSVLPALLLVVLLLGPPEVRVAAGWIGAGIGGLWTLALLLVVRGGRRSQAPSPVVFTAKLCVAGGTIYAWPNGIAKIGLDEDSGMVFITRKSGPWMQARTFVIPVPEASFGVARGLLPS